MMKQRTYASKLTVENLLKKLRLFPVENLLIHRQQKTLEFMRELDLDREDVVQYLHSLSYADYCHGPDNNDWENGGKVWVFGLEITEGVVPTLYRVYIKLEVKVAENGTVFACMSFHPTQFRMTFPLVQYKSWGAPTNE